MGRWVVLVLALLWAAPPALAGETFLESRTELRLREADSGEMVAPLREYLSLSLDAIGDSFVSIEAGGWGGADLAGGDGDGDLSYGWVQLTGSGRLLRLGRQTAAAGVAAELIDGVYGRADLRYGLSAALFAGLPVAPDPDEGVGDLVFGGRVAQGLPELYEVGLSYVRESDGGTSLRSLAGFDLRLTPASAVTISGRSDYNVEGSDWARHAWRAALALPLDIRVTGEVTWASYAALFANSNLSAFWPPFADPEETMTAIGLAADVPLGRGVTLTLRGDAYGYAVGEDAMAYSGTLDWSGTVSGAGAAVTRLDGGSPDRSCLFARAWGSTALGRLSLSADCSLTALDEAVNGTKNSMTATLNGGWDFSPNLRLAGSLDLLSGPAMEAELRGGLTLIVRFGSTGRV